MEYFKVIEEGTTTSIEVNRDYEGNFNFKIAKCEGNRWIISLSATEARDLMEFISKRLSENEPPEVARSFQ